MMKKLFLAILCLFPLLVSGATPSYSTSTRFLNPSNLIYYADYVLATNYVSAPLFTATGAGAGTVTFYGTNQTTYAQLAAYKDVGSNSTWWLPTNGMGGRTVAIMVATNVSGSSNQLSPATIGTGLSFDGTTLTSTAVGGSGIATLNGNGTNTTFTADAATAIPVVINGLSNQATSLFEIRTNGVRRLYVNTNGSLVVPAGASGGGTDPYKNALVFDGPTAPMGFYRNASSQLTLQDAGFSVVSFIQGTIRVASNGGLVFSSTTSSESAQDVALDRNSAGRIAVGPSAGGQVVLGGTIFASTAGKGVTNSVTETSVIGAGSGTLTLPANLLIAGRTIRITVRGHFSDDAVAPGTVNIIVKFGATTICTTGALTPTAAISAGGWKVEADITCRTTGVSGTVIGQGVFKNQASATTYSDWPMVNTATTTINTTTTQAMDVTWTWGTADTDNSTTGQTCIVEVLR